MKNQIQPFGELSPWAEPAWYNAIESPYYNDSHRRLRAYVREYVDEHVLPYAEKWEEEGGCPPEVSQMYQTYKKGKTEKFVGNRQICTRRPYLSRHA
jgi:hypothetical protein